MAFTETQRATIRRYLGWSAIFRSLNNQLEQSLNAVDGWPETQTEIEADLAKCADLETRITAAYTRIKAKKVGSIDLPGNDEIMMLRAEGRKFAQSIAKTLGVELLGGGYFGGWSGMQDNYARHG